MKRIAECCCGACTIEAIGQPEIYGVCHCNDCKKRTGSAFGMSAYFLKIAINSIVGETQVYHIDNENWQQQRHFCNNCGTTLFWHVSTQPDKIGISAGCFIQQSLPEPKLSLTHENKCIWLELPDDWTTSLTN